MKIFSIINNYPKGNKTAENALSVLRQPSFITLPDTTLTTSNRPFFIPDIAEPCTVTVQLAVRIGRLGRCIAPRFAYRYRDAATVCAVFVAQGLLQELQSAGLPWDAACAFDGCVAVGRFSPLLESGLDNAVCSLDIDGKTVQSFDALAAIAGVDDLIAQVSRCCTLRQGDILLTDSPFTGQTTASIGTRLTARLNGEALLDFNVK
ncbi:MAG: fumarylacetoacetate hydrolase family protein [Bacteroidales bacterium]|nr:fumarylacetoacetate hydrolase family protein [Bacteroidales bacterium]